MVQVEEVVGRLRWQLGLERIAVFAIRGTLATGLVLLALATVGDGASPWFAGAPLFVAIVLGVWRWPSDLEAAQAFDRRAHLDERLATATELTHRARQGRFDLAQIADAVAHAESAPRVWLTLDRRAGVEAAAACGALIVAALCWVLIQNVPAQVMVATDTVADATPGPVSDELAQRALPLDVQDQPAVLPTQAPAVTPNLAGRVQQEQAERSAMDALAQGLSNLSAGQVAADAIQQGDYAAARDQLQSLADNADQLSEPAKQQFARGLQRAAAATGQSDKALATREQQAAQALTRSTYVDQRQALGALADQVQRSGASSVAADQLERDQGQLQLQLQQQQRQQGNGPQNGDGQNEQGGPGVGSGPNPDPVANTPSRLETSGQKVQVPLKLGNGPGVRPSDGTEDQSVPNPSVSGRSVSELSQSQQTGQVAPEQNLVPGEQRSVVRGYFR